MMFSGGSHQCVIVYGETAVIRMPDNMNQGIFKRPQISAGILKRRAAVDTGLVQAGNGIVQGLQDALFQVHGSVIIHNIQFHAHHQPDAVKGPWQDFEINEMEGMAAAGHGRGMVGASKQGQSSD